MAKIFDFDAEVLDRVRAYNVQSVDYSKLKSKVVDFTWESLPSTLTPRQMGKLTYKNGGSTQITQVVREVRSFTSTYQIAVTTAIKIGIGINFRIGTPFVGGGMNLDVDFSKSETETQGHSETESKEWSTTITIPAKKEVEVFLILKTATYSPKFSAKLRFRGIIRVNHPDGSRTSIPIEEIFKTRPHPKIKLVNRNLGGLNQFGFPNIDSYAEYDLSGKFHGVEGTERIIEVVEHNLIRD